MKDTQRTSPDLAPEQEQIVRSHWEWGGPLRTILDHRYPVYFWRYFCCAGLWQC
jgi:hypothetical protein